MAAGYIISGTLIALAALALDLASKHYVLNVLMQPPRTYNILPVFDIVLVWNKGISFGMLSSHSSLAKWALVALAGALVLVLLNWLVKAESKLQAVGLGLIIGGAVGNIVDRLTYGAVVDFLSFHYGQYYFPAFNAADSFITIGVILLILDQIFGNKK